MNKDVISTPNAPAAVGPYSQGIRVGDIFLGTTADGKKTALMVADICQSDETGEKLMLLVQGGAPAQQLHIVENPGNADLSP